MKKVLPLFFYADNGNITSIGGVGTLIYGGGAGVSPYEVTGLTPEPGQPAYRQRAVTYNTFDRPETIAEGAYTSGLVYDADGDRVKMYVSDTLSGPFVIRYYIGGRYEYDLFSGTERLYLGGDAYSAPMVLIKSGAGGWIPYQIGRDYLGSITDISDLDGQSFQVHYRYDPWGRLVDNSTGQPYAPGSEPALLLGRGYTGHEYLPWFGLINANARLYDPLLGRFLSPDPYVQDPDFSQNYNRYSYCLNNPLKYTDESGELFVWSVSQNGFSIGINFTPIGVPLGFGFNFGWTDGFSLGLYGELGYRVGGKGLGAGYSTIQSIDYNFKSKTASSTISSSLYASFLCFSASISASVTTDLTSGISTSSWNAGLGIGFGGEKGGMSFSFGYGSGGISIGCGGNWDPWRFNNNPTYSPEDINDNITRKYTTNCYDYAIDSNPETPRYRGHNPGEYTENYYSDYRSIYSEQPLSIEKVFDAAIADGYVKKPSFWNKIGFGKYNYYEGYLVTKDDDYHWYRRDSNGYWSHKPGITPVTNLDASGSMIRNIFKADYGSYRGGYLVWIRIKK